MSAATTDSSSDTASVITTVSTSTSTSLTTSFSTVTITSDTATFTSTSASVSTSSSLSTIVSTISVTPSTTYVPPSTTSTESASVVAVTDTVTRTPTSSGTTLAPTVVVITSTYSATSPTTATTSETSSRTSSASSTPSALSATSGSGGSGGLSSGAKIAIAVIIPVVVIAAAFLLGLFFWKKRKARKDANELRKSEMAEYGFNPNRDPTLAPAGPAVYADDGSEAQEDNSGYRGWGPASSNRQPSTTLGSNGRAPGGLALSESSSQPGGPLHQSSPNAPPGLDQYATDPLTNGHPEGGDGVAELGGAAVAGAGLARRRSETAGIHRGPSNASSAYSTGHQSEASSEAPAMPGPYYQEEVPYNIYNDAAPHHGPYGDGSYGGVGGQPVIRDVQARRNTRIERAPTFPQTQGGIAQNF